MTNGNDLIKRVEKHGWHKDDSPLVYEMRGEIERLQKFERWYESADSTPVLEKLDAANTRIEKLEAALGHISQDRTSSHTMIRCIAKAALETDDE